MVALVDYVKDWGGILGVINMRDDHGWSTELMIDYVNTVVP